jgi:tRNA A37 methylthiotransferase MiaB
VFARETGPNVASETPPPAKPAALPLSGLYVYSNADSSCASSKTLSQRHADFLVEHGCEVVSDPKKANILLVDTCAYSASAEAFSLDVIRSHREKARPGARLIVTGCLSAINPGKIEDEFSQTVFSARNEEQLAELFSLTPEVRAAAPLPAGFNRRKIPLKFWELNFWKQPEVPRLLGFGAWVSLVLFALDRHLPLRKIPILKYFLTLASEVNPGSFVVTISQGCVGNCTFCAIPLAKGRTRSYPLGAIIDEVRRAVALGATEITLASEDTGAYGSDIGTSIVDLLDRLNKLPGNFKINIDFFDPRWLRRYDQALIDVLSAGRVAKIQLPLQSASNSVLGRMSRAYQMEHVIPVVHRLRQQAPDLLITTEFIVGFPGETEAEYAETKRVVESGLFDFELIFPFSNRPNTKTNDMPGHLPQSTVLERARALNVIIQGQLVRRIFGARRTPSLEEVLGHPVAANAAEPVDAVPPAPVPVAEQTGPVLIDLIGGTR